MARRDGLLERALLDTSLQLGPQESALRSLLSQLAGEYTRKRRVNASNARGIKASTQAAQPQVARAFDTALSSVAAQRAALGAGGPADPQAAAFERRIGEQRASGIVDLVQQGVRADTGRVFANQQAREEYEGAKGKVLGDLQELGGRAGALTANTYGKLQDDQLDRDIRLRGQDITEANNLRSNDIDPATGRPLPRKPKAPKLASQEAHAKARDSISQAIALIEQQRSRGMTSRAEIIRLLSTGRESSTREVDGQKVTLPAIPRLPADFVRAATNLAFDGTLSRGDVTRLHNRRLRIRSLGYPTRKAGDAGPKRPQSREQTAMDVLTGASQGAIG